LGSSVLSRCVEIAETSVPARRALGEAPAALLARFADTDRKGREVRREAICRRGEQACSHWRRAILVAADGKEDALDEYTSSDGVEERFVIGEALAVGEGWPFGRS
jgi:hypothetical protein